MITVHLCENFLLCSVTSTAVHAEEASLARLSYSAFVRAEEARLKVASKLSVKQIAKMAIIFCLVVGPTLPMLLRHKQI